MKSTSWMEEGRTKKSPPSFSADSSRKPGIWVTEAPFMPPSTVATHMGDSGISIMSPDISAMISDMFFRTGG